MIEIDFDKPVKAQFAGKLYNAAMDDAVIAFFPLDAGIHSVVVVTERA